MTTFLRNILIVVGLFVVILVGINSYSLSVTHNEFLKSMRENPQHAYFYITPQAKQEVTIEDMSSYQELAASLSGVRYSTPPLGLTRKRTVQVDLDPMDRQEQKNGQVVITYAFEGGRWVVAKLNIKKSP